MTTTQELIQYLGEYVTEHKREIMARVLSERTRYLTIMLEDIYQPHNASACMRSCDCLGVQDVHIVESRNEYKPNTSVAMGSTKWLSLHRYTKSTTCIDTLRSKGYRLVATTPASDGYDLLSLPIDQPIALLFGTEEQGLTEQTLQAADATLRLPMYGFTQSFNISVTVALALSRLTERLRSENENTADWRLSDQDKDEVILDWYRKIVKRHELLEKEFWSKAER